MREFCVIILTIATSSTCNGQATDSFAISSVRMGTITGIANGTVRFSNPKLRVEIIGSKEITLIEDEIMEDTIFYMGTSWYKTKSNQKAYVSFYYTDPIDKKDLYKIGIYYLEKDILWWVER